MNMREKLADFITGGAVTRALGSEAKAWRYAKAVESQLEARETELETSNDQLRIACFALRRIEDMLTPNAAHGARKMAGVASEALNKICGVVEMGDKNGE